MFTITAVIRVKPGQEAAMRAALLDVASFVAANEPGTVGYFVSQSADRPELFTTYERFADRAAMDRHNKSPAVASMPPSVTSNCVVFHFGFPVCGSRAITAPLPTASVQLLIGLRRPMPTLGAPGTGVLGPGPPPVKLPPGEYVACSRR